MSRTNDGFLHKHENDNFMSRGLDYGESVVIEVEKAPDQLNQWRHQFIVCAIGIFVCYFISGVLTENITKGDYRDGEKTEKFTYFLSLLFVQCVINGLFARLAISLFQTEHGDKTPTKYYAACSMSYLGAMWASNQALQFVSYPTQVLGKSAKPIPVMILGIILAGKRYPKAKFLYILMIVIGVAMFLFKDSAAKSTNQQVFGFGEVLLLVSLTLDGFTGAAQDRMKSNYKTGAYYMMFNMNLWSVLWLALGLLGTGEVFQIVGFIQRYPSVVLKMFSFGLASAVGQVFIFVTVTSFGPLPCSVITTTRKFFTILGSVIIFQNPMSSRQWLATVLVFLGLGLDSAYGKEKKNAPVKR